MFFRHVELYDAGLILITQNFFWYGIVCMNSSLAFRFCTPSRLGSWSFGLAMGPLLRGNMLLCSRLLHRHAPCKSSKSVALQAVWVVLGHVGWGLIPADRAVELQLTALPKGPMVYVCTFLCRHHSWASPNFANRILAGGFDGTFRPVKDLGGLVLVFPATLWPPQKLIGLPALVIGFAFMSPYFIPQDTISNHADIVCLRCLYF